MEIIKLLQTYGWQLTLLGILACCLVGAIKTPIKKAIDKKYAALDPDSKKVKTAERIFDTCTVLGTILVAFLVALTYLFLANNFSGENLLASFLAVYSIESATYIVWKKLGLKTILLMIWEALKNACVKAFDKNKDGHISFDEATQSIQEFVKDGKLDVAAILKKAEDAAPGVVEEVLTNIQKEAQLEDITEKTKEDVVEEASDALKNLVQVVQDSKKDATDVRSDVAIEKSEEKSLPEAQVNTQVVTTVSDNISIIKL